jgi:hypothetical protein
MSKNTDLGFMTMGFITNAVLSKEKGNIQDCIFQIGQAKGMWFTLKMLGFDIEETKKNIINQASKEEFMPVPDGINVKTEDAIELFEAMHQDVMDHMDQIMGGMLLYDAQR